MFYQDLQLVIQWWMIFFVIGIIFLPMISFVFAKFFDKGYIFAKIIGTLLISYTLYLLGILKILKFTQFSVLFVVLLFLFISIVFIIKNRSFSKDFPKLPFRIFLFEEFLFFVCLVFWSYVRGHQPDIQGLEKFMDFGFVNSILRSDYFPPKDMWFTPLSINYYYFGHLITAVLTKLSGISSFVTYNLMISTLFAFTFTMSFSIGINLFLKLDTRQYAIRNTPYAIICGLLAGFLTSLAGNLHTIYTFSLPYQNENPKPIWELVFSLKTFPNAYWYPNATRFIHNTIHEFPIYSFVVSDLHGHVLGIPIILTIIAVLFHQFLEEKINKTKVLLLAFLIATAYMTNAWDGPIYILLTIFVFSALYFRFKFSFYDLTLSILLIVAGFFIFSLPFSWYFKPFASGIGILCAPQFLTKIGKIGPFLFEIDHCQKSPLWQMVVLYGFFYFWVITFLIFKLKIQIAKCKATIQNSKLFKILNFIENLTPVDLFIFILIFLSTLLIIIPEFIYLKDIYPAHYRANTMFKLVYQSFIMLSISSAYIIMRIIFNKRGLIKNKKLSVLKFVYLFFGFIGLFLVLIYPYFAINSYYGELKSYKGLFGFSYFKNLYPTDYQAVLWLNKNIQGQPVILEAQGDSYTDYARISANTGLPTVLGWTVHEWLWRGTYDIPAPRIAEVQALYENNDINNTKTLINKYHIAYIFIGSLERKKYQNLNEDKFMKLGRTIYKNRETTIYKITNPQAF